MISKEEASDLKSLIDRSKQCAVVLRDATLASAEAERRLEDWIFTRIDRSPAPAVEKSA